VTTLGNPLQTGILVALIGAVGGVLGGAIRDLVAPAFAQRRAERAAKAHKAQEVAAILSKYRDPLIRSSFELQSRLRHIIAGKFLSLVNDPIESQSAYAVNSTL
jgi:hypothetical protein